MAHISKIVVNGVENSFIDEGALRFDGAQTLTEQQKALVRETIGVTNSGGSGSGTPGIGIKNIEQTVTSTADGGTNIITITKTDNSVSTFTVQNGSKGSSGYTPVRGTDYWTDADKAEIKSYVDEAILGGAW